MDTQIIRQRFSKAARSYDKHALIQRSCAEELLKKIAAADICPQSILDIGTGTGNLLSGISAIFRQARLVGLDFSREMLLCAERKVACSLVQADTKELPFRPDSFDLIVSNLTFQWLGDLGRVFRDIYCALKNNGSLYFTIFGPQTLKELKTIFPALNEQMVLQDAVALGHMLKEAGFSNVNSSVSLEKRRYLNMIHIVRWLKDIGANYVGYIPSNNLGMRRLWQEKEEEYRKNFSYAGAVFASFELIFMGARKIDG